MEVDSGPTVTLLLLVPTVFCASLPKNGTTLGGTIGTLVGMLVPRFRPTNAPMAPLLSERHDLIIKCFFIVRRPVTRGSAFVNPLSLLPILTCNVRNICPVGPFVGWRVRGIILLINWPSRFDAANGLTLCSCMTLWVTRPEKCLLLHAWKTCIRLVNEHLVSTRLVANGRAMLTCTLKGVLREQENFCLALLTRKSDNFKLTNMVPIRLTFRLLSIRVKLLNVVRMGTKWLVRFLTCTCRAVSESVLAL